MAVKDIRSNLISQFMGSQAAAADATTPLSGVIDGADYELGVMFSVRVATAGTATSVTLVIQESDDRTFGTFSTISPGDDNYIGSGVIDVTTLTVVPDADPATIENRMLTAGVISNLRFLRPAIVDVGGATYVLEGYAVQKAEEMPTAEADA